MIVYLLQTTLLPYKRDMLLRYATDIALDMSITYLGTILIATTHEKYLQVNFCGFLILSILLIKFAILKSVVIID